MFGTNINILLENIPKPHNPQRLDLVLDGGAFNGSYMVGGLMFLKAMEENKHVKVEIISSCSIGSVCGLLYHLNEMELFETFYEYVRDTFQRHKNLNMFDKCFSILRKKIPKNFCKKIKDRLIITYYNANTLEKVVKTRYKNIDELFETIRRSCHVPFMMGDQILHRDVYMDGLMPYVLQSVDDKKILHFDLYGRDILTSLFTIKNEITNRHRILSGMLDVHLFFIKNTSTQMCSYINNPSTLFIINNYIKLLCEIIIIYAVYLYMRLCSFLKSNNITCEKSFIFELFIHLLRETYYKSIEYICL